MENSIDITRKYQFLYMLGRHFAAVGICFVIEAVAFLSFFTKPVAQYICSGIFTLVYGGILYSAASRLAGFDRKPYTPLRPELKWGIMWGVMISIVIALFIVMYKINWAVNNSTDNALALFIINVLFYICIAPFWGFVRANGMIPVWTIALMLIIPVVSCTLGYYAGMKKFDLIGKLDDMTFEKDEK
ncbi:MAG: hypothetical protein IJH37_08340 [Clostridia bacterium]|nr:hypothetical protein [Clostridia bacterium]